MNIIVIGLGSMGKRRIRLIKETHPDYVVYGVDAREGRRQEVEGFFWETDQFLYLEME